MYNNLKKIHIVGIGGIGVSAVAKLLMQQNVSVSGSDSVGSEVVDDLISLGASISIGHSAENVPEQTDLIIYSGAVPDDNPERVTATEQGIEQLSYFQFLGQLSKDYKTIVVSGTHGKSTTTAMLGKILEAAGLDPTVIVGTKVPGWKLGNLRIGSSDILLVEGCEYMAHMLELDPWAVVLTNVEEDHLDYYRDIDHIRDTFQKLVDKVPQDGFVVRNADDSESMKLKVGVKDLAYSLKNKPNNLELQVPGDFNLSNALAAIITSEQLAIDPKIAQKSLLEFSGVWRRFEIVGKFEGATVVSDYAHHPTAIKKTLEAAGEKYSSQRLVVCFQPHQHSRTRELFDDFIDAFDSADELIISEIYGVVGRTEAEDISSRDLVYAIQDFDLSQGKNRELFYAEDINDAERQLRERIKENDLVIVMGAGDIDQVARHLCR